MLTVPDIQIYYSPKLKISQLPIVTDSKQAYHLFMQRWDKGKIEFIEEFKILLLNKNNRVLGIYHISTGGMCNTVVDPKVIFIAALKACSTAIILAHNHPSGNLKPSANDITITQRLKQAGQLLDIMVLDHLIITYEGFTSLNEQGLL